MIDRTNAVFRNDLLLYIFPTNHILGRYGREDGWLDGWESSKKDVIYFSTLFRWQRKKCFSTPPSSTERFPTSLLFSSAGIDLDMLLSARSAGSIHNNINNEMENSQGLITTKFQTIINRAREGPLNAFEQIRWTCEIIKPIWACELDHWTLRNKDRHGHTPEEEAEIKRDRLLQKAHELFLLKREIDPKYRKIIPSWRRIKSKRTNNLEQWINTTTQSVHYLLNVNKQADDDPPLENEVPPLQVPPNPDPARFEAPVHTFR
jgi:hypothetical protein